MLRRKLEGLKWKELTEEEKKDLLKDANAVDEMGNDVKESGEYTIDLKYPYSVPGRVSIENEETNIEIDENAVIYNPTDITPAFTLKSNELIEKGMELKFSELWEGVGNGEEFLEDESISMDNETMIEFEIVNKDDNVSNTLVKVTDIY